jgi:hypothetical protein
MRYSQNRDRSGIDDGEYWILDVAVEYSQYISSLSHPKEYLEAARPFQIVSIKSIECKTLQPWEATYWKMLPIGYYV